MSYSPNLLALATQTAILALSSESSPQIVAPGTHVSKVNSAGVGATVGKALGADEGLRD